MHQALVGLPDQSRDEQQTKSEGSYAGAVDPSSVSQTWEAVSHEETWITFYKSQEFAECNVFISGRKMSDSPPHCVVEESRTLIEHLGTLAK